MKIELRLPASGLRRWHAALADALRAHGRIQIMLADVSSGEPSPALNLLLSFDRLLNGGHDSGIDPLSDTERAQFIAQSNPGGGPFNLAIDLTGLIPEPSPLAQRTLIPLCDGSPGESGLWAALLDGRAPLLEILDVNRGHVREVGRPALPYPDRLHASATSHVARILEALAASVTHTADHGLSRPWDGPQLAASQAATVRVAAGMIGIKAKRALMRRLHLGPQWVTAYRSTPARNLPSVPVIPSQWNLLPDDGRRFFADPFVIAHQGRRHVFVEEFPFATERGIISHFEIDGAGRASAPQPVLETDWHLSYPQVFEDGGALYMLPEASASGRLTLYRATGFPVAWEPVADLIGAPVHDATLVRHAGRYWLFASSEVPGSSSWDSLSLYWADRLTGPWHAHPLNPVLLDAASARPGGAMFIHDGQLFRPAQDCSGGYGSALAIARVDRLDPEGYEQTRISTWTTAAPRRILGPHTWNYGAGLDVIDLYATRRSLTL